VLVVPWLLEREYRQHRALDDELPATYAKWLVTVDARLEREAGETRLRIVKVVIHPGEIETWASNTGRPYQPTCPTRATRKAVSRTRSDSRGRGIVLGIPCFSGGNPDTRRRLAQEASHDLDVAAGECHFHFEGGRSAKDDSVIWHLTSLCS
jgi:hypothetical protein